MMYFKYGKVEDTYFSWDEESKKARRHVKTSENGWDVTVLGQPLYMFTRNPSYKEVGSLEEAQGISPKPAPVKPQGNKQKPEE